MLLNTPFFHIKAGFSFTNWAREPPTTREGLGINGPNNIPVRIHSCDREICIGMAGKSDLVKTSGMDHVMMSPRVAGNAKVANNDSIPAHIGDSCTRGARKPKRSKPALIQQESVAHVFAVNKSSRNASQIIQRDRLALGGRRREIQLLKRAFPALGERSSGSGGDEKDGHQQTQDFSVAFHKSMVSLRRSSGEQLLGGTLQNEMSCCWSQVARCAAELVT
jgi:hypothetical protein